MGGKGVPEGMWADIFLKSGGFGQLFDEVEDRDAGDVLASFADEHIIFVPGFYRCRVSVDEVEL